jgi:Ca2+-dependent lipid-binding protein
VVIEYNGKSFKTPVMDEAGKTPVWNYTLPEPFIFGAQTTGNEEFKIKCLEDDIGKDDDDVGEGVMKLSELVTKELTGVSGKWFTLTYGPKKEKAAEIQIDSTF